MVNLQKLLRIQIIEELEKIDRLVNEYVKNSSEVTTRIMTPKAAIEKGA